MNLESYLALFKPREKTQFELFKESLIFLEDLFERKLESGLEDVDFSDLIEEIGKVLESKETSERENTG